MEAELFAGEGLTLKPRRHAVECDDADRNRVATGVQVEEMEQRAEMIEGLESAVSEFEESVFVGRIGAMEAVSKLEAAAARLSESPFSEALAKLPLRAADELRSRISPSEFES